MARQFTKNDTERLRRELGISFEEAEALLRRVGGDAKRARKLYVEEHSVVVEPDAVADGPSSALENAREALMNFLRAVRSARIHITRDGEALAALPAVLVMLAMLTMPALTFGSVIVMLFLRFRFSVEGRSWRRVVRWA